MNAELAHESTPHNKSYVNEPWTAVETMDASIDDRDFNNLMIKPIEIEDPEITKEYSLTY